MNIKILGIESSCDDTAAAVIQDGYLLASKIANQDVHKSFGGVVPELASRAHQQNIIPVVDTALKEAGIDKNQINAVAFTRGPGLMGSLLVGGSFTKGLALALNVPIIEVNHLQAHILAHFIQIKNETKILPKFPFLCLLVSGGHTQLVIVKDYLKMDIIGQTIDDAAGEAFDKCAKVLGLPYPGGPLIDKYSKMGNPVAFNFNKPRIKDLDFSFSGLKTSFLYFLRDMVARDKDFVKKNFNDICSSIQRSIIEILIEKLIKASEMTGIKEIGVAGGVAANSGLRESIEKTGKSKNWNTYFPELRFTTDNAAMIAITGYYKFLAGEFTSHESIPFARLKL